VTGSAKKQPLIDIALHGVAELLVSAKLAYACDTIAQAAVLQAIKRHIAFGLDVRAFLQNGKNA
jgi:hypothetical protein